MKCLITGGAGYIGSHAVRLLIEEGLNVTVLDNLSTGHREAIHPDAAFTQGDIGDTDLVRKIVKDQKIDSVLHFAAHIEVGESVSNPYKYYRNNFSSALSFFNAAIESGVHNVVFSSTAAVYGSPERTPISEDDPHKPLNPYGRSKLMTEWGLRDLAQTGETAVAVLRYFNVAGAHPQAVIGEDHQPESHLIPRILQTALRKGEKITPPVYGTDYPTPDGTCLRDYVHVSDLVQAHLLALRALKPKSHLTYNLGSEKGFSVLEVIELCRKVTGAPIEIEKHARRAGDPAILIASSEKIRRELGWSPKYADLKTIIEHAWNWHRTHPNGFATKAGV